MMSVSIKNPKITGDTCPDCNGKTTVIIDGGGFGVEVDCPTCHGVGVINSPNACKECFGSATVVAGFFEVDCPRCNGSGLEPENKEKE